MAKKEGKREVSVVNIVISSSLEQDVPLEKMAATLSNTEYNPEQFPGLVLRLKEPKSSLLVFSSGKIVCTGTKTLAEAEDALNKLIKLLEKINIKISIKPKIVVQNIVASGNIGIAINLNALAMKLDNTEYEPEQFPGLVYKLSVGPIKATFLLFSNGEIVCAGTKSKEDVDKAVAALVENLKKVG